MTKKEIIKIVISVLIAALTALAAGLGLSSCNVTRHPNQNRRIVRRLTEVLKE